MVTDNGRHLEGGNNTYDQPSKTWSGMEMLAMLRLAGAGAEDYPSLKVGKSSSS